MVISLTEQCEKSAQCAGGHEDADQDQQSAADLVDDRIMLLDKIESGLQFVDEDGAEQKRNAQTQGIAQQHTHSCQDMPLLGGQHQRWTKESADTGGPAYGEDNAKNEGGEKTIEKLDTQAIEFDGVVRDICERTVDGDFDSESDRFAALIGQE